MVPQRRTLGARQNQCPATYTTSQRREFDASASQAGRPLCSTFNQAIAIALSSHVNQAEVLRVMIASSASPLSRLFHECSRWCLVCQIAIQWCAGAHSGTVSILHLPSRRPVVLHPVSSCVLIPTLTIEAPQSAPADFADLPGGCGSNQTDESMMTTLSPSSVKCRHAHLLANSTPLSIEPFRAPIASFRAAFS